MAIIDVEVAALIGQIGFEDVFVPITVEIASSTPCPLVELPRRCMQFLMTSPLFECAISLVDPQVSGGAVIGNVNVGPAIAVEVGAHDPEAWPDGRSNSCSLVTSSNVPSPRL